MSKSKTFTVKYKRKREGRTNYKKRLNYIKSNKPRVVIRLSLKNISIQIVEFHENGDKILYSTTSNELKKYGWKAFKGNIPASYLTGLLCGVKIKEKIKEVIVDFGLSPVIVKSRLYAALKGLLDAGIKINVPEEVLPEQEKISGKIISDYASKLSENKEAYEKQFSSYLKNKIKPEDLPKHIEEVKSKIMKGDQSGR